MIIALVILAGCRSGAAPGTHRVEQDTIGDTVVIRTVSGSEWGGVATLEPELRIGVFEGEDEYMFGQIRSLAVGPDGSIYVMDAQVPALRKYSPIGEYIATFGREGEGPGEYRGPDGGLAVLNDGRVVLRDPRNARLQVYSSSGEALDTWPIRGGFQTSDPLYVDTAGRVLTQVLLNATADVRDWRSGLASYDSRSGEPGDTIPAPTWDYDPPRLMAQSADGTSTSVNSVPFSPTETWSYSPFGYMVGGLSTRYAIDQYLPDGTVRRAERVYEPIAVQPGERANQEEVTRWSLRRTQPDWRWNGPAIPDEKPPFRSVLVGQDGRLWVQVYEPAERIPADEIVDPAADDPAARPASRWREPVAFDVFEADGTYLGRVRAPVGFATSPRPVFHGDNVWAVVRDELDVQYVTRFRIQLPSTREET